MHVDEVVKVCIRGVTLHRTGKKVPGGARLRCKHGGLFALSSFIMKIECLKKKCLTFEPTFWYCPIPIKINLWRKWYVIKQLKNRGLSFFSLDQLVTKNQIINTKWQSFLCTSKFEKGRGQPGFRKINHNKKLTWCLVFGF